MSSATLLTRPPMGDYPQAAPAGVAALAGFPLAGRLPPAGPSRGAAPRGLAGGMGVCLFFGVDL